MKDRERSLPDWKLERLALGELPPERLEEAQKAAEGEGARLEQLDASNRALMSRFPAEQVALEVHRRAKLEQIRQAERRVKPGWLLIAPGLAAAALALVVLRPSEPTLEHSDPDAEAGEVTREKGLLPHLQIYRQLGDRIERLRERAATRAGERLQLSYVSAGRDYGVVFSIDGAGALTLHLPEQARSSVKLERNGEVRLQHSYELDDAPGFERFFFVTSSRPFAIEPVLEAGRTLARRPAEARTKTLPLPAGLEQDSLLLEKR